MAAASLLSLLFLSTPSARRATSPSRVRRRLQKISIHALREEGDFWALSTSAPRSVFLSTPSARRATPAQGAGGRHRPYFYPRPPRGGRLGQRHTCGVDGLGISIHALREEGDQVVRVGNVRRAEISIHALREEGDDRQGKDDPDDGNFYPRPPRGGRPVQADSLRHPGAISIHALREEGDVGLGVRPPRIIISIHALREEGDMG